MSLYNLVAGGHHPTARVCVAILRLDPGSVPRFRDAWITDDGKKIVLLTRTGGPNREEYGPQHALLAAHPLYIEDANDGFDSTYARYLFDTPEEFHADLAIIGAFLAAIDYGEEHQGPAGVLKRVTGEWKAKVPERDVLDAASDALARIIVIVGRRAEAEKSTEVA